MSVSESWAFVSYGILKNKACLRKHPPQCVIILEHNMENLIGQTLLNQYRSEKHYD